MFDQNPLIIAHRGASGYLPEHTLEAKALAYGLGAHYLEQDVVATRDDRLVVLHDIHLDRVTDVAARFPTRHRQDRRYYARDFDLAELQTLTIHERRTADGTNAVYPGRFPTATGHFRIPTLSDEIEMILGLNASTGRTVGLYPEIKRPAWHREEGVDVGALLLAALDEYGFSRRADPVYVQCFDPAELRRIRGDLGSDLRLIQLIGENAWSESDADYEWLRSAEGLAQLSEIVDGIGPWLNHLYTLAEIDGQPVSSGLVSAAHAAHLEVHAYTFRADEIPVGFAAFGELVQWFVTALCIDGLFTDFPDRVRLALEAGRAGLTE
ncbi:MAG: glycerophosphodiester phosphodiesterase [Woeseiaceae bacterium]